MKLLSRILKQMIRDHGLLLELNAYISGLLKGILFVMPVEYHHRPVTPFVELVDITFIKRIIDFIVLSATLKLMLVLYYIYMEIDAIICC